MQYDTLKSKAVKILIGDSWPFAFTGQMPLDMKEMFIEMADEIDCMKTRIDQLEKKMTRAHFGQMQDSGETES